MTRAEVYLSFLPSPVSWLLGSTTYVGEFLYGKGWPEPTQMREINDDNTKAISARMDAKGRDATWYGEAYHRANVQDVIAIED